MIRRQQASDFIFKSRKTRVGITIGHSVPDVAVNPRAVILRQSLYAAEIRKDVGLWLFGTEGTVSDFLMSGRVLVLI
jgi:hypothetical protein